MQRLPVGRLLSLLLPAAGVLGAALYVRSTHSVSVVDASMVVSSQRFHLPAARTGLDDWPQWRGRDADGVSRTANPPCSWSRSENIDWATPLPGTGHSSPVVWGDTVFVTAADETAHSQSVLAVDLASGHLRWSVPVLHGKFPVKHETNTHASATPACDGQLVYAAFVIDDAVQVAALTLSGEIVWRTTAGPFISQYGYGSSPTLYGSLLIVNAESRGSKLGRLRATSFLAGLNRGTGEVVWRIRRPEEHGFGSPVVGTIAGRDQLILSGGGTIDAYDPATGKRIWTCRTAAARSANTAAFDGSNVYVSGTYPNPEVICIRADGQGDVSDTHVVWKTRRGAANVPSPVLCEGRLYVLQDTGIVNCFDAASGKLARQKRLSGTFTASPIVAGGYLFAASETGTTTVVKLNADLDVVATNEFNEPLFATPTPTGSSLLIRTARTLRKVSYAGTSN